MVSGSTCGCGCKKTRKNNKTWFDTVCWVHKIFGRKVGEECIK